MPSDSVDILTPTEELPSALEPIESEESKIAAPLAAAFLLEDSNCEGTKPLSKNALKRIVKSQRWEEGRDRRKQIRREKAKQKRSRSKSERELQGAQGIQINKSSLKPIKPISSGIRIVIDCGFDDKMTDKEIVSISAQLARCYSDNRRSASNFEVSVASFDGRLRNRMDGVLNAQYKSWKDMKFVEDDYLAIAETEGIDKNDLVYLTADSANTVETLEPSKTYIIGGIVDRNRHKNICKMKADSQGIATARLPIGEYIKMASRQVLTVNQVLAILLAQLSTNNWEQAFVEVIPKRKNPQLKVHAVVPECN